MISNCYLRIWISYGFNVFLGLDELLAIASPPEGKKNSNNGVDNHVKGLTEASSNSNWNDDDEKRRDYLRNHQSVHSSYELLSISASIGGFSTAADVSAKFSEINKSWEISDKHTDGNVHHNISSLFAWLSTNVSIDGGGSIVVLLVRVWVWRWRWIRWTIIW